MSLIKVKNLSKTYKTGEVETKALCEADFVIEEGEFVAIMGPSGSGKSTLMQILGFLDKPTDGEYFFQGTRVDKFSEDQLSEIRNQEVGFVFQAFNLLPRTTVYENVELPLLYKTGFNNKKENEKKVKKALEAVSLSHRLDYFSNQISGGQKQRVAIARALVNNPKVIFADEPTGNLDSKSGKMIMEIFQKLNKEGKTIILVTHEDEIAEYARRIIRVEDGKVIKDKSL
jgi:putative ABC transport system ATP-binding protein